MQKRTILICLCTLVVGYFIGQVRQKAANEVPPAKMPINLLELKVAEMPLNKVGWVDWNSVIVGNDKTVKLDTSELIRDENTGYTYQEAEVDKEPVEHEHHIKVTRTNTGYELEIPEDWLWQSTDAERFSDNWVTVEKVKTYHRPEEKKPENKVEKK